MKKLNNMIKLPLVLAITGSICAVSLGLVHQITAPVIEESKNAAVNNLISEILPGAKGKEITEDYKDKKDDKGKVILDKYRVAKMYEITKDGNKAGYGYRLLTKGYNGDSDILVIVNNTKVIGAKAISLALTGKEIPSNYLDGFKNKEFSEVGSVDLVGGVSLTSGGLRDGIEAATNAHTELILGGSVIEKPKVSEEDFAKLGYENATFVEKTEEFKTAQGEDYEEIFAKMGVTNAYHILNETSEKLGYFYLFDTKDKMNNILKGLLAFNADGTNTKLVILKSTNSISYIDPSFKLDDYVNQFNGFDINTIKNNSVEVPDKHAGATLTTDSIVTIFKDICINHKDY